MGGRNFTGLCGTLMQRGSKGMVYSCQKARQRNAHGRDVVKKHGMHGVVQLRGQTVCRQARHCWHSLLSRAHRHLVPLNSLR